MTTRSPLSAASFPVVFFLLLCVACPSSVGAWTTGSGTCNASATSVTSQTGRHPITPILGFYLTLPTTYTPSQPFTFTINNTLRNPLVTAVNGFLLYAQDSTGRRVGTFSSDSTTSTTNVFNAVEATNSGGVYSCYGAPGGTLTHANGGPKSLPFSVTFTPPSTDIGPLTFHGLIEFSKILYYTQILTPLARVLAYLWRLQTLRSLHSPHWPPAFPQHDQLHPCRPRLSRRQLLRSFHPPPLRRRAPRLLRFPLRLRRQPSRHLRH